MGIAEFLEETVQTELPDCWEDVLNLPLIVYLNQKTRSVIRDSKARGSFGNLYAIYVLVEDYTNKGFTKNSVNYSEYAGMRFADFMRRQRQLPFGEKLQNHAINHRCNEEFLKFFPNHPSGPPIIRDKETSGYWINEKLLKTECAGVEINIANLIMKIIDRYVELKREGFEKFFQTLLAMAQQTNLDELVEFVRAQLNPEVDARIFEIISFAILKLAYSGQTVIWGEDIKSARPVELILYKTGRTNSNDGGIDFIMRPTGQIYQVTEVLDFKKYFLDIDKINKYPINFVVKIDESPERVLELIRVNAERTYKKPNVLRRYLNAFESVITIPTLEQRLKQVITAGQGQALVEEIIVQCQVEFNIPIE